MKREIYETKDFTATNMPDYECPTCGAPLQIKGTGNYDSAGSKNSRKHNEDHSFDDEAGVFHLHLECTRGKCGESVVAIGESSVDQEHERGPDGWEVNYVTLYRPQYFLPHLKIFEIPANTPDSVRQSVEASFNLFFVSTGSSLNEIRNAVEFLMDELEVPRKGMNDENPPKEVRWDLDTRVGKLSGEHRKYKQHLQAIKNLGNWGSHAVSTTRGDVLDAYKMVSYVLDGIYDQRDMHVTNLAQRVKADKRDSI